MAESDFRSMQEEAVKRVMEMQRRSRSYTQEGGMNSTGNMSGMGNSSGTTNTAGAAGLNGVSGLNGLNTPSGADNSGGGQNGGHAEKKGALFNLAGIQIDEEKAMIALLIYILYKNKADMKLLLGLGYLLL